MALSKSLHQRTVLILPPPSHDREILHSTINSMKVLGLQHRMSLIRDTLTAGLNTILIYPSFVRKFTDSDETCEDER